MIIIEKTEVMGFEQAIRGMRNPMNSWDKSDSGICKGGDNLFQIGKNDHELMMKLVKGGPVHAKFRRMIAVYMDVTAPLYWWKEFDTYKVGTVANSCSTMHKIHAKEFVLDDFSHEKLINEYQTMATIYGKTSSLYFPQEILSFVIVSLNTCRKAYLETNDKKYWWQMIQLLPSSYNQKRTIMLNYEVLAGIYPMRRNHKLDEWHEFCHWIEGLPYSEIITCNSKEED